MKREREERLQIMLSEAELQAIDDFRFKYRVPSRAAAIRELLRRGLAAAQTGVALASSHSRDFGVIDKVNCGQFELVSELGDTNDPNPTKGRG